MSSNIESLSYRLLRNLLLVFTGIFGEMEPTGAYVATQHYLTLRLNLMQDVDGLVLQPPFRMRGFWRVETLLMA